MLTRINNPSDVNQGLNQHDNLEGLVKIYVHEMEQG